jgi:hypothetical protein
VRALEILCAVALAGCARQLPEVSALPSRPELPDPLVGLDGHRVTTREEWLASRRPELKRLFQHYMYGFMPPAPERVRATVRRTDPAALGGKATLKELTLVWGPPEMPTIDLLLIVPNQRRGLAPVFLGLNFGGNHAVLPDPKIALARGWMPGRRAGVEDNRATDKGRGADARGWAIENTIDRGYAVATFYHGDVDPDRHDWTDGVHPHYFKSGQSAPGPHDWGTIAAWAWGLMRGVDYLVGDPDIDPKRIALYGHSRNGKTALLAAAFDERVALVVPHQAGCGGTAPSRTKNPKAETVKRINDSFPHWFNDAFTQFNDAVERLPFDQHCLVALCAPRPVLFTNGVEDQWADPEGQFQMLRAADPVYRLLGAGGLDAAEMPPMGKLVGSRLGYFFRAGGHTVDADYWNVFLDFADKNLGKP